MAQVGPGRPSCTAVAASAAERPASVGVTKKTRESGFFIDRWDAERPWLHSHAERGNDQLPKKLVQLDRCVSIRPRIGAPGPFCVRIYRFSRGNCRFRAANAMVLGT